IEAVGRAALHHDAEAAGLVRHPHVAVVRRGDLADDDDGPLMEEAGIGEQRRDIRRAPRGWLRGRHRRGERHDRQRTECESQAISESQIPNPYKIFFCPCRASTTARPTNNRLLATRPLTPSCRKGIIFPIACGAAMCPVPTSTA